MPNWCNNSLLVTTIESNNTKKKESQEQLQDFIRRAKLQAYEYKNDNGDTIKEKGCDLSMNQLYPMPTELEGTKSPSDTPNWYDWRCNNWGTKWDVDACLEYDEEDMLEYSFDSAWSPPTNFIEKVSKDFPLLRFRLKYEEEGNGFMGVAVSINGHLDDQCIDYY